MAYNIMKGIVEFSSGTGSLEGTVDLSSDQSVAGGKTFVQRITASAITLGGTNLVVPAITAISNDGANRVFTSDNDGTVTAQANVTITNNSLTASFFSGSGVGLTSLQAVQITGQLSASQIHIGNGLVASSENITVSGSDGVSVSATGVTLDLMASHGLVFSGSSRELAIDPSNPAAITDGGQSLADADSFVVYDASRSQTRKATADNIYSYINGKLSTAAITSYTNPGDNRIVTSVNSNTVNAEANLTFDGTDLLIAGNISGSGTAQIGGNLTSSHIVPNADEQYDLGQSELRYENAYFNFMNGGVAFNAVNDEGVAITKGQVVYIKGVSGGTPTVALAACDVPAKMPAFGFVADGTINQGAQGRIVTMGRLNGINTSTLTANATLYVQTGSNGTSGSFTTTTPTGSGNLLQNIGRVTEAAASGQIRAGGAGRTNATPNLDKGYIFVGNDTDQSVADNTIYVSSSANRVGINTTTPRAALDISGSTLITGSLEISGSGTNLLKLHKGEVDTREIEIYSNGSRQSAITLNGTEQLFIENESTKDIVLRTNNQNTLRVFGQNQRVGIAKEGTSANAELDVDGNAIVSGSLTVSGSVRTQTKLVSNTPTANYNVAATDNVVVFNVSASFVARLPEITTNNLGVQYYIKSIGAGAISVTGSAGAEQYIDGQSAGKTINQGDSLHVGSFPVGSGFDWAILSFYDAS